MSAAWADTAWRPAAQTESSQPPSAAALVPANPDGQDLVANWYMREADTLRRTTARIPRLYQKYAGHDNNRDAYMASQPETQAMDFRLAANREGAGLCCTDHGSILLE